MFDRLNAICEFIHPYTKIADIGCDHGYLIKFAKDKYNIDLAYAIDNKIGPLSSAKDNLKDYDNITYFLSDGLSDVDENIECIIISGMGGLLIKDIINDNLEKAKKAKRIIIEANRDESIIRKYLLFNGFIIENEKIIKERNHYYEIDSFKYEGNDYKYSDEEILFGPILLKQKSDEFIRKWQSVYHKLSNIDYDLLSDDKKVLLKGLKKIL